MIIVVLTLIVVGAIVVGYFSIPRIFYEKRGDYYAVTGFYGSVKKVEIKETKNKLPVLEIDDYVFQDCGTIKEIVIPSSIQKIGKGILKGAINLESMKVPFTDEINTLGYYFEARNLDVPHSVTKVEINSEITTLKENAFSELSAITEIILPNTITKIEARAFEKCAA